MGNLCECLEQQPPPEEQKKKKEHKTRLSAQQLLESTETGEKNTSKKDEGSAAVQGDGGEEGETEAAKPEAPVEAEPAKVETEVEKHEEPAAGAVAEGEKERKEREKSVGDDQEQPLLTADENERRKSTSSSSSSSSSEKEKEEEGNAKVVEETDQSGQDTEPQRTELQPEVVVESQTVPEPEPVAPVQQQTTEEEKEKEDDEEEDDEEGEEEGADSSDDDEGEDPVLVAGGSRLMRAFVDGCQLKLSSRSSSRTLRIMEDGSVNALGGNGKRASFTVHVKGTRKVALQNVKDPEKWLQVKDDELSGTGTGDEHCHFNLSEHGGYVVFEPVLAPGTHIGVRENGEVKKPSHTGTRKHARFTPVMKNTSLAGESPLLAAFKTGRRVYLTSRVSGKSLRIVEKEVNGLGGKGKKASFFVHVRRDDVVALQNVKDPKSWLRIRDSKLEGNGKGGRFCELRVAENDGHVTLESVAAPGNYVGIDSEGGITGPTETDPSSESAHFKPNVKLQKAGDSELLSRFTEENVIVLESRASEKTLRFREGQVEGTGGHGALAQFIVHVKRPGIVALQNRKEPKQWLRIWDEELNHKGSGGALCHWSVQEVEGYVVLESVRYPGQHVGVRESGEIKKPSHTGKGTHAQFTPIVIGGDETD